MASIAPFSSCVLPEDYFPAHYKIEELLHAGANSTIYKGIDTSIGIDVILKCFDPDRHRVYLREVAAAFGIIHPNLNRCLDTFYLGDGYSCIVYEYIHGGTLAGWVKQCGTLQREEVFDCLQDLLTALGHLHDRDRIHCDLKPENIFYHTLVNGLKQYVLGDFSAVCFIHEAKEQRYTTGSPAYMAPERHYDRFSYNSDLYSLGIVGFELITGRRPFSGTVEEIMRAHLHQPVPCHEIADSPLRDFIERLVEKDPAMRIADPRTALGLLSRLRNGKGDCLIEVLSTEQDTVTAATEIAKPFTELTSYYQTELWPHHPPHHLLCFHIDQQPVLGLQYTNHIEFIDPPRTEPFKIILNSGQVQILNPTGLAYKTASQVYAFDIKLLKRKVIRDHCNGLAYYYYHNTQLLWMSQSGRWTYCHLSRNSEVCFRSKSYAFPPRACIQNTESLWITDGTINQEITLRDGNTKLIASHSLDGPILDIVATANGILVVTINVNTMEQYSIWRICPDNKPEKIVLPGTIRQWQHTPGYVYWIAPDDVLYSCNFELLVQSVHPMPRNTELFSVSTDHQYLAAIHQRDDKQNCLNIWKTAQRKPS